jgi:hypothetical protein
MQRVQSQQRRHLLPLRLYEDPRRCVEQLRRFGRLILCTEYMARPNGSTLSRTLPT